MLSMPGRPGLSRRRVERLRQTNRSNGRRKTMTIAAGARSSLDEGFDRGRELEYRRRDGIELVQREREDLLLPHDSLHDFCRECQLSKSLIVTKHRDRRNDAQRCFAGGFDAGLQSGFLVEQLELFGPTNRDDLDA